MGKTKTAGLIIIGNEILSGKVRDENSFFAVRELRDLGIDVKRITVIPDDTDVIGKEAVSFSEHYDYVFTSGGVGPTHDDVTVAAIARGFGVNLVRNDEVRKALLSRYKKEPNEAVLKMTEIPEGAEIIFHENRRFPVISFRNIFIFPGIPEYFRTKFTSIKERFRSNAFFLKRIFINCHETDIAATLTRVDSKSESVTLGSYPVLDEPDYRVIVTVESKSQETLDNTVEELLQLLPDDIIVRIE